MRYTWEYMDIVLNEYGGRNKPKEEEFKYFVLNEGKNWSWMNMRSSRSQWVEKTIEIQLHKRNEWRRQIKDAGLRREAREDVPFQQDIRERENKIYIRTFRTFSTEQTPQKWICETGKKRWSTRFAHILFLKRNKSSMNALCLRVFNVLVYILLLCSLFL